jgi:hypothetical protein
MKAFGGYRRNLSPTGERTLSLANDQHTSTDTCLYADVRLLTFEVLHRLDMIMNEGFPHFGSARPRYS